VAKPWWDRFFAQHSHPVLDQMWNSVAGSEFGERLAGSRFFQLIAGAVPAGDTIRGESAQPTVLTDLPLDAPVPSLSDFQVALQQGGPAQGDVTTGRDSLSGGEDDRIALATFGGVPDIHFSGTAASPFGEREATANYVVLYSDDFQSGLVMNTGDRTLLTGGPGDWPELGQGPDDTLELSGDFSAGFTLPSQPQDIDTVVLHPGNDYNLISSDEHVGAGQTMTINAMPLGIDGQVIFDGSAERDGNFVFFGSQRGDVFLGGAGDDRIVGLGGADMLSGGGGSDTFVYTGAGESTGSGYDTLADFTAGVDHIDLLSGVASFGTTIESGSLSTETFDNDLGALLGGLESAQAVWVSPDSGDLAGKIFLVVDANGIPGYQPGEDYVFGIEGSTLADLTGHTDIFV
jgi:Ca2+-binding RTX toxin-like protein